MPKDVTPWFTAFRAYSVWRCQSGILEEHFSTKPTYLHKLAAGSLLAWSNSCEVGLQTNLGEKVVSENEYRSAITVEIEVWQGGFSGPVPSRLVTLGKRYPVEYRFEY